MAAMVICWNTKSSGSIGMQGSPRFMKAREKFRKIPGHRRALWPWGADAMKIAMIGAGYVGLVSGACFSEFGVTVVCIDKDADRIARLQRGDIPIFEPGLDDLVARNAQAGRLAFSSDLPAAVAGADAVFIAVGTPSRRGDGHADLTYVYAAAREIAHALTGYAVVLPTSSARDAGMLGVAISSKRSSRRQPKITEWRCTRGRSLVLVEN